MDRLLSMCFEGPPSEEQLLNLLGITKEERAKAAADEGDRFGMLSSSSSDETGQRRSTRIRAACHQGAERVRTRSAASEETGHHHGKNPVIL